MSLDSRRPPRAGPNQDPWSRWAWLAVPVVGVVVLAGLWWAIFSPSPELATMAVAPTMPPAPTEPAPSVVGAEPETRPLLAQPAISTPASEAVAAAPEQPATDEAPAALSEELLLGALVNVTGTAGLGLNMRVDAGTEHAHVKVLFEGLSVQIVDGPKAADGHTWWQVRDEAGVVGWVVAQFLMLGDGSDLLLACH
jgi:hypothetical protein